MESLMERRWFPRRQAEKSRNSSTHEGFCTAVEAVAVRFWEEKSGQCGVMLGILGGSCAIEDNFYILSNKKKRRSTLIVVSSKENKYEFTRI